MQMSSWMAKKARYRVKCSMTTQPDSQRTQSPNKQSSLVLMKRIVSNLLLLTKTRVLTKEEVLMGFIMITMLNCRLNLMVAFIHDKHKNLTRSRNLKLKMIILKTKKPKIMQILGNKSTNLQTF